MWKSKLGIAVIGLTIMLSVSIFFSISYRNKNIKYENYLSEQMIGNTMRPMGSAVISAKPLMEKIINTGEVSRDDMLQLYTYFETFAFGFQDLQYLYSRVMDDKYVFYPLDPHHLRIHNELWILQNKMSSTNQTSHILSTSELQSMKRNLKVTESYASLFGQDYLEWDYSISNKVWVDLLMNIDKINSQFFEI